MIRQSYSAQRHRNRISRQSRYSYLVVLPKQHCAVNAVIRFNLNSQSPAAAQLSAAPLPQYPTNPSSSLHTPKFTFPNPIHFSKSTNIKQITDPRPYNDTLPQAMLDRIPHKSRDEPCDNNRTVCSPGLSTDTYKQNCNPISCSSAMRK